VNKVLLDPLGILANKEQLDNKDRKVDGVLPETLGQQVKMALPEKLVLKVPQVTSALQDRRVLLERWVPLERLVQLDLKEKQAIRVTMVL